MATGPGFSPDDIEEAMLEWKVATDALFNRKPTATVTNDGGNNNKAFVASTRNEWQGSPHLMPQFDRACLALSSAQLGYLDWVYNDAPTDLMRARYMDTWRQCYMLVCMDLVRCKEFFLRNHWLSVHASIDRTNDVIDDGDESDQLDGGAAAAASSAINGADDGVKMHVQRIQVIFPLVARAMLCVAESQSEAVRNDHVKLQAQQFGYCATRLLCVEYGPVASYSCSKYHHAIKALACEWPTLPYDDELQAYVEALLLRAAQLLTVSDSAAVHDVTHYRTMAPATTDDDDGSINNNNNTTLQYYVMNDRFARYLAVTFADMLADLLLYGQFDVHDLRHGDAPTNKAILHERHVQARLNRRNAYEQEAQQRALSGEEPLPPLPYSDEHDNDERFERIADALCVDGEREDTVRAWLRRAEHDPSCNKSRRFVIVNACLWALRPGEMEIFRIDNANRSVAPRDVLRTMRGRTINDMLSGSHKRLGTLVCDEMTTQERQRQASACPGQWPDEGLLLQLALYEYCNTACFVFANRLELSDYAITNSDDIEIRYQELVYSRHPILVRIFHHFQVAFHGVLYRYDSFVRAFAAWLELMHIVHESKEVRGSISVQTLREAVLASGAARQKNRERRQRRRAKAWRQGIHDTAAGSPLLAEADNDGGGGGGDDDGGGVSSPRPQPSSSSSLQSLLRFSTVRLDDDDDDGDNDDAGE